MTLPHVPQTNKLIQGDALTVLKDVPDKCIDLSVTSPPYNKQEKNNGGLVSAVKYDGFIDNMDEGEYRKNQESMLNEAYRVTKEGGSFFYNHKIRFLNGEMLHPLNWLQNTDWIVKQEIIWDRTIAGNIRGWRFWQVEERIYWLYKPVGARKIGKELASKDAKMTSIWRAVPENHNPHPAPFPLWLPTRILVSLLDKPSVVLDPYIGSGTTAVSAVLLGHTYIGVDTSEKYIEYAEKRIKNAESEREKIEKEVSLHVVKKSFAERKKDGSYKKKVPRQHHLL